MDKDKLLEIVGEFSGKKVVVVGDVLLDSYVSGKLRGHNPDEEGKDLLTIEKEENALGGAGNVASNLAGLRGNVWLYGVVGNDIDANLMEKICTDKGIKCCFIREGKNSLVKRRFIDNDKGYLMRVDYGEDKLEDISEKTKEKILSEISSNDFDIIILSDYNKRIFKGDLPERIIEEANKRGVKVIVDPKPVNVEKFSGCDIICPNLKEAREIIGEEIEDNEVLIRKVLEKSKCKSVAITLGERGLIFFDGIDIKKVPAYAKNVSGVMGAGDSFMAALGLSLAVVDDFNHTLEIASHAVAIVVEQPGTSICNRDELIDRIRRDE